MAPVTRVYDMHQPESADFRAIKRMSDASEWLEQIESTIVMLENFPCETRASSKVR